MTTTIASVETTDIEKYLRQDRMPHIFCTGCGIGPVIGSFLRSIDTNEINPDLVSVVSGIGCSGRVAGYVKLDSFHTTHGRALPFATGLKMANPELNVVVFSLLQYGCRIPNIVLQGLCKAGVFLPVKPAVSGMERR